MRRLAGILAATVALAACGDKTVDQGDMESGIKAKFADRGVTLHDVSCSDDTKAEVGARITCTALNPAGTKLIIGGRVTAVHGDRASFHFDAARGVASGDTVAAQVKRLLERKVGQKAAGMTCPSKIRIPTTRSVTCRLTTLDGKVYDTKVFVNDHGAVGAYVAGTPIANP